MSEKQSIKEQFESYKIIPIPKIVKADWNYKEEDAELTKKLTANIKRNGQIVNCIVRELEEGEYELVDGNHRIDAAKAAGHKQMICMDLGKISKEEAIRIAIEINETKFPMNQSSFADNIKLLLEQFDMSELIETMPFNEDEMKSLLNSFDVDYDDSDKSNTGLQMSENLEYRIVVDCDSETHQAELLDKFINEGIRCRALIS